MEEMKKKGDDSKVRKLSASVIISYIFVGFFVLLAIGASQSSGLAGLIFFIAAAFLVPPINSILFQKLRPFVKENYNSRLIQTAINVLVAFVLFVVGASFLPSTGETASNKTATTVPTTPVKKTEQKIYSVSAERIVQEFNANEVAADMKYSGSIVEIRGYVYKIDKYGIELGYKNSLDASVIGYRYSSDPVLSGYSIYGKQIKCYISDKMVLSKLRKEQYIKIKGRYVGVVLGVDIKIKDCEVL